MPSKAPETLYAPDSIKAQLKPVIDIAKPLLGEVLQYGLCLFARASNLGRGDENLPLLFVYRHLLEMLDSVAIQVCECAPAPAALQLRAMFEALLTIEYMTRDKSKTRERAMAYLYKVELKRRRFYLSKDPKRPEGAALQKFIADDPYAREWKGLDPAKIAERVAKIDKMLQMPELEAIAAEYKAVAKKRRDPEWYSLFGGPANIAQLAQILNRAATYTVLYRQWSERTHSADAIDRILTHDSSGKPFARSLRDASELNEAIVFAVTFSVEASRLIVGHYFPGDETEFATWQVREVSPLWKKIPKVVVQTHHVAQR